MISVRTATKDDAKTLAEMGLPFIAYSDYGPFVTPSLPEMQQALERMMDIGVVFAAEDDGRIVGGIVAVITSPWMSPSTKVAAEMAWWLNEEYRGGRTAFRLLDAFEEWARSQKADIIVLSDLVINGDTPIGKMVSRLGYTLVERSHVKKA